MSGRYTITITPKLLAEGEHKGHVEYFHFTADDGSKPFDGGLSIPAHCRMTSTPLPRDFKLDEIPGKIGGAG
jgi:hypothetical protein